MACTAATAQSAKKTFSRRFIMNPPLSAFKILLNPL